MDRTGILDFISALDIGPPDPSSTAEWVNLKCPLAPWTHSKGRDTVASFGVKVNDKGASHCNCFTCHYTESFASLAYKLGSLRKRDYQSVGREIERQEFIGASFIPKPYRDSVLPVAEEIIEGSDVEEDQLPDPAFAHRYESAVGQPYLRNRGIDAFTTANLGLRFDPFQRRVLFPVYDVRKRFRGFSGRRTEGPWGANENGVPIERNGRIYLKVRDYGGLPKSKVLLGEHAVSRLARPRPPAVLRRRPGPAISRQPLILVEGLFDYAYLKRLGFSNVIGLLGSHLAKDPTRRQTIESFGLPLIMFFDNDQPGRDAKKRVTEQLFRRVGLSSVVYPPGYDDADPASLPPSVVFDMLASPELVTDVPANWY